MILRKMKGFSERFTLKFMQNQPIRQIEKIYFPLKFFWGLKI